MNFDEKVVDRIKRLEREVERLQVKESPGAWLDWTPTVTWVEGTAPTSTVISSARYCKIGKLVFFNVAIDIVKGSGTGKTVTISPPATIGGGPSVAFGRTTLLGSLTAVIVPVSSGVSIQARLGGAMTSDGHLIVSGFYEAA